jgi:hypothetical protein
MVNKAAEQDLAKIKRLIASALSPREKAMYENLLDKAEKQIAEQKHSETATEVEATKNEIIFPSTEISTWRERARFPRPLSPSKSTVKQDKPSSLSSLSKEEIVIKELPPENNEALPESEVNGVMFQAIGIIEGEISVNEKSQLKIILGNRKYRLGYTGKSRKRDYAKLLEEISSQGSKVEKISVYPQVNYKSKSKHGGEKAAYEISFNLVSVEKPTAKGNQKIAGIFGYLAVGEFQISGYWQYVGLSSCPCITVMRNHSEHLAQKVNKADPKKAKRWLRPNHLPVEWLDSSLEPFKYDSSLKQQEQMPRLFVQTKVRFEPESQKFMVIEELDQPRTKAPRCLKVK